MPRRKRVYRLFKPRYEFKMIRDQIGDSAFGNGVRFSVYLIVYAREHNLSPKGCPLSDHRTCSRRFLS